ncbi:MAG TPA: right-handed parallel beta-helix repeat-containing protein [Kiritimatiellae bacterium]|nr:right-handed parallel beta-helix repeat-containing protein [Kiritimatiellia bacterium]
MIPLRIVRMGVLGLLCGVGAVAVPTYGDATLNYQGRVTAGGSNYSGMGYFKFRLLDGTGQGLWGNDGSGGSNEPASSVAVEVNNGLFNVDLGAGMTAIPPPVFHREELFLRSWFSTDDVTFEQLSPDVEVRPVDYAAFNSGGTVVVDDDGDGDFNDIQAAIDYVAANPDLETVLVMPGLYQVTNAISFPTGDEVRLIGMADRAEVVVENASGAVLNAASTVIRNMSFIGSPALTDPPAAGYSLEAVNCTFRTPAGSTAAVVRLDSGGTAEFFYCRMENDGDGEAVALVGNASARMKHCILSSQNSGAALEVDSGAGIEMESCTLSSGSGAAMVLVNSAGSAEFGTCRFLNGIVVEGPWSLTMRDCLIEGDTNDVAAVILNDSVGQVVLDHCIIRHFDAPGVLAAVSSNGNAEVVLDYCWLESMADAGIPAAAVDLDSDAGPEAASVIIRWSRIDAATGNGIRMNDCSVEVIGSQINSTGHGIEASGGLLELWSSMVEAESNAIHAVSGCEVEVKYTFVEGGERGIHLTDGAVLVENSELIGMRDCGMYLVTSGEVSVTRSTVAGSEEEGTGQALYAALEGGDSPGVLLHSMFVGEGGAPAFEMEGGTLFAVGSVFVSETNRAVLLRSETTRAAFDGCEFVNLSEDNTNLVVELYCSATDTNVSAAEIMNSVVRSLYAGTAEVFAVGTTRFDVTGEVSMVNCSLSHDLAQNIFMLPASNLNYGCWIMSGF